MGSAWRAKAEARKAQVPCDMSNVVLEVAKEGQLVVEERRVGFLNMSFSGSLET